MSPTNGRIDAYMTAEIVDNEGVNMTELAENACYHFNDYTITSAHDKPLMYIPERYFEIAFTVFERNN